MPISTNGTVVARFAGALYNQQLSNATYSEVVTWANTNNLDSLLNAVYTRDFSTVSDTTVATTVVSNLGLSSIAGVANWLSAQLTAAGTNKGAKLAEILNGFAQMTSDATYGTYATAWNNQVSNAQVLSQTSGNAGGSFTTIGTTTPGVTFTLTTGVDSGTAFTGGAGSDTFNATATATFNALDSIDGGAGTDTLNVLDNTANVATTNRTVKNIEVANLSSSGTVTADTTGWTGLTTLTAVGSGGVNVTAASTTTITASNTGANAMAIIGGGGASTFSTGAAAVTVGQTAVANGFTSVSVTGGTTVDIANNVGAAVATTAATSADTLKTVSLNGNTGNASIVAKGLTAINATSLVTAGQTVTNTDIDTAHTLALSLNAIDVGSDAAATAGTVEFIDGEATSVAVSAVTGKSYDVTLTAAKATAVTVDAAVALQMDALTAGVATTVGISGAGAVTITADTLDAAAVVTSTNTGGVTLTQALTANQQFVGTASTGVDTIGVATAFTKAISTGAGNDVITYGGPAGSGGSIDAGADTDTIVMTGAQAETATGSTTFAGTVSNFEVLKLSAATGAARAINMANADGINKLSIAGATVGALTVTGAAADFTLEQRALTSFASSVALASDVGTTDNVNLAYTAADGFTSTAAFTIANVESLKITTTDADTTAQTAVIVTPITATSAATVTVSGNMGVSLIGGMTQTTLTSLDASGLTATGAFGGLTWTSGALAAAATVKGSAAGTNTVTFSAATGGAVTYTGGTGNDVVTGSNGKGNIVDLGAGTNSYTQVGAGNSTITGGTGADTITVGTGANTVHLGGGTTANSVTVGGISVGLNVIDTTSTGVDTYVQGAIQSAAGYYSSLTGWTAGDKLDFAGVTASASVDGALGAKITLGGVASFANYLDAAAAGSDAAATNAYIKWFQFGGNTYVVVDNSDTTTFADGVDTVVELVGTVNLATSTVATDVLTLV